MDAAVESQIESWRHYLTGRAAIAPGDVAELEAHLRDQVDALTDSGLAGEEAFLVAIRRLGALDELSREYAHEHSDRLWKQLVVSGDVPERRREVVLAVAVAVLAAVAIKVPALFGIGFGAGGDFYAPNLAVLVLPFLAGWFLVRRRASAGTIALVAASFAAAALVVNLYPFVPQGMTAFLTPVHIAVVLWLVVGIAYAGGDVVSARTRMDFIRFTGEWAVYLVLIGLGGGVLIAATTGVFSAVGLDASRVVEEWVLPCGLAGAVVVAGVLVEAKQSVIENIAPVLTRVFTPLFAVLLLVFIGVGLAQGNLIQPSQGALRVFGQRDLLIVFDLVLVIVLGLLLYALSARDPFARPGWFEALQLVLVVAALVVDLLVLIAMIGRIGSFGASPNKIASLGLNLILLANLAGAAWLHWRFLRGRAAFGRLESWQTAFVPVYLTWAAAVAVLVPPLFGFR
ncbi:MAG: permease prefix domain 1-containing protein [Micropruina sp.]|uniref:permease prefix domain 1-containing protein n=1 Tax=Micropruina sp. TaxID=2737536 RepID=UPI0039E45C64